MRILIVGCGYVGLPLGAALTRQGHEVFGLRRNPEAGAVLEAAGVKPLFGDIGRPTDLARLPSRFDWVVNTVSSSRGGADDYRLIYLEGTRHLIEWLAPAPPLKFVYTSSTSVYAQNDGSVVDEASATEPDTGTSRVLLETEQVLLAAARERRFPAVILRLAGIYGPGRGHYFKQFVAKQTILADSGQRMLNMIHRDDVVGAIIAALARGRAGEIYNAVDDEPVRQGEFLRWLAQKLDRPMPLAAEENGAVPRKRGLTNKTVSNRKLRTALGYQLKFPSFREGYANEVTRVLREEGGGAASGPR